MCEVCQKRCLFQFFIIIIFHTYLKFLDFAEGAVGSGYRGMLPPTPQNISQHQSSGPQSTPNNFGKAQQQNNSSGFGNSMSSSSLVRPPKALSSLNSLALISPFQGDLRIFIFYIRAVEIIKQTNSQVHLYIASLHYYAFMHVGTTFCA